MQKGVIQQGFFRSGMFLMLSVFGAMGCAQSDLDHLEAVALDGSSWRYLVP